MKYETDSQLREIIGRKEINMLEDRKRNPIKIGV